MKPASRERCRKAWTSIWYVPLLTVLSIGLTYLAIRSPETETTVSMLGIGSSMAELKSRRVQK
jgi:hypothetical protein